MIDELTTPCPVCGEYGILYSYQQACDVPCPRCNGRGRICPTQEQRVELLEHKVAGLEKRNRELWEENQKVEHLKQWRQAEADINRRLEERIRELEKGRLLDVQIRGVEEKMEM